MASFFGSSVSQGLQAGIKVINSVDSQRFPLLLSRISQYMQNNYNGLKPFSNEEEEKLTSTLDISQTELKLLIDCSALILKQAAFNVTKPPVLYQQLKEHLKLNEDKAEAFVSTWANQAKNIVDALKKKSTHPYQVEGVSWMLDAVVGSSDGSMLEPRAMVELKLRESESGSLRLDLTQSQLLTLYEALEDVQGQLDNLR